MERDLCEQPAWLLAHRIRRHQVSAAELLDGQLERIERLNPVLNAIVSLDVLRARKTARAADEALARGENWGPLHGVPMTLKDGHDVAGLRTTLGTQLVDRVADANGTVADRLQNAGAIILGHSNVAPWLADYQTVNPIFGRTRNPWDLARTPGGSSGGAAAAVAAGLTPLEVGSDLNGSVRLPAHFCGVYGLKTTEHRVPMTGFGLTVAGLPRGDRVLDGLGPMARDLRDLELALRLISGPDDGDPDVPPAPLARVRTRDVRNCRLAVAPTLPGVTVARDLHERVEQVAAGASDAGMQVSAALPSVDWSAAYDRFANLVNALLPRATVGGDPARAPRTLDWYLATLDARDAFAVAWAAFFHAFDALIVPPAMTVAFPHQETGRPLAVDGQPLSYWGHGRLLGIFNMAGLPALVVPAGHDPDGMPVGVQLVGPRWSETRLLAIANALEAAGVLPGFKTPPIAQRHDRPSDRGRSAVPDHGQAG